MSGNETQVHVFFSIAGRVVNMEIPFKTDEEGFLTVSFPKKGWIEPKEGYDFFFKILGTRRIKVDGEELTKVLAIKISKDLIRISRNNVFIRLKIPIGREFSPLAPLVVGTKKNITFWFMKKFNREEIRENELIILELENQNSIREHIVRIQL